jgi:hypothetical protein
MKFAFAKAALLVVTLGVTAGTAKADYTLAISDNMGDSVVFNLTTGHVQSKTGTVNVSGATITGSNGNFTIGGTFSVGAGSAYSFGNRNQVITTTVYSTPTELDMTLNAHGIQTSSSLPTGDKLTVTLTDHASTSLVSGNGSVTSTATGLQTATDKNTKFATAFNGTVSKPTIIEGANGTTKSVSSGSSNTLSDSFTFTGTTASGKTLQAQVEADVTVTTPAPSSAILVLAAGLMFGLVSVYRRGYATAVAA